LASPNGVRKSSPELEDCRAALARVLASQLFQASPKLAAFLRFVVEAALSGQSDRIKGYTIGTEALGRGQNFDPQVDPIVRVEAGRLRRTLDAYYAGTGSDDPVVIALPVGSYVPTFTLRAADRTPSDVPVPPPPTSWWRGRPAVAAASATMLVALAAFAVVHTVVTHASHDGLAGVPDRSATEVGAARDAVRLPAALVMPLIAVEPIVIVGAAPGQFNATLLRQTVQGALARFDDLRVQFSPSAPGDAASVSSPGSNIDYRLAATLDARDAEGPQLTYRLIDSVDRAVVWSKTYRNFGVEGDHAAEEAFLLDLMSALAGPDGVIQPNERRKRAAGDAIDPRYSCLLDAYDYWHRYRAEMHAHVRACLEHLTATDPDFSLGFAGLTYVYVREHYFDRAKRTGEIPAIDRALDAARRAVEINPNSALAYHALSAALFARNNAQQGIAASEKAAALNPYDVVMISGLGFRLVRIGELDRGLALLRRSTSYRSGLSSWYAFTMSIGSYLTGDLATAAKYDLATMTDTFPPAFIACAVVSAKTGNPARAQLAIERLVALQPGWRDDPRGELAKIFDAPWIVDRLAGDLAQLGLRGRAADVTGATAGAGSRDTAQSSGASAR